MDHGVTLLEVKRQTDTDGLCNGMPVTSATSHEVEAFSKMRLQFMVDYAGYPSAFLLYVKYPLSYRIVSDAVKISNIFFLIFDFHKVMWQHILGKMEIFVMHRAYI